MIHTILPYLNHEFFRTLSLSCLLSCRKSLNLRYMHIRAGHHPFSNQSILHLNTHYYYFRRSQYTELQLPSKLMASLCRKAVFSRSIKFRKLYSYFKATMGLPDILFHLHRLRSAWNNSQVIFIFELSTAVGLPSNPVIV